MIKQGLARFKLVQAHFFETRALEAISAQQRESFLNFLEAAIVFARSVTFFLQKEYRHTSGFNNWYLNKVDLMNKDPIFKFFEVILLTTVNQVRINQGVINSSSIIIITSIGVSFGLEIV